MEEVKNIINYLRESSLKINEERVNLLISDAEELIGFLILEIQKSIKAQHLREGKYILETTHAKFYKKLEDRIFRKIIRRKAQEFGFIRVKFEQKKDIKTWRIEFIWFDSRRWVRDKLEEILIESENQVQVVEPMDVS